MLTSAANFDHVGAGQPKDLVVARPRRRRDKYVVARSEQREARIEERLLAPGRDDDLVGRDLRHPQPLVGAAGDARPQRLDALNQRVACGPTVQCPFRRIANERGGWKVGLARTEVDNGLAGSTKRLCSRRNGDRGRLLEVGDVRGRRVMLGHRRRKTARARSLRNLSLIWSAYWGPLYLSARQY